MTAPTPWQPHYPQDPRTISLQNAVAAFAARGWTVTATGPTMASLTSGTPVNHVLHVLVTMLTCGLWLPIWLIIAVTDKGVTTGTLTVDEHGAVWWSTAGEHRQVSPPPT